MSDVEGDEPMAAAAGKILDSIIFGLREISWNSNKNLLEKYPPKCSEVVPISIHWIVKTRNSSAKIDILNKAGGFLDL